MAHNRRLSSESPGIAILGNAVSAVVVAIVAADEIPPDQRVRHCVPFSQSAIGYCHTRNA